MRIWCDWQYDQSKVLYSSSSCRITKLSSSIALCMLELYHWTLEDRPRCRGVRGVCIATCETCSLLPRPHSHVVPPLKYPHFFLCSLLQVYPVLSLFRHLQLSQGLSCPVARSSYRLTKPACAFSSSLLFHSLTRTTFAGKWTGWTLVRKLLLDFRRLLAGVCPNREWVSLSTCLVLSTLAHTLLLISGGAIPASKLQVFYVCWP